MKIPSSPQPQAPLTPEVVQQLQSLDRDLVQSMAQADGELSTAQLMEIQQLSHQRALAYDMVQQSLRPYKDAANLAVRNMRA